MTARAWKELRPLFKLFSKTVKPWLRKPDSVPAEGTYDDGWNDCIAAMKKAEAAWFKGMDEKLKARVIPFR